MGLLAEAATPARADARHQHAVARRDGGHTGADRLDGPDRLMPEDGARRGLRDIALEDVQIAAADRRGVDPHDGIGGIHDRRIRDGVPGALAGAVVDEGPHAGTGAIGAAGVGSVDAAGFGSRIQRTVRTSSPMPISSRAMPTMIANSPTLDAKYDVFSAVPERGLGDPHVARPVGGGLPGLGIGGGLCLVAGLLAVRGQVLAHLGVGAAAGRFERVDAHVAGEALGAGAVIDGLVRHRARGDGDPCQLALLDGGRDKGRRHVRGARDVLLGEVVVHGALRAAAGGDHADAEGDQQHAGRDACVFEELRVHEWLLRGGCLPTVEVDTFTPAGVMEPDLLRPPRVEADHTTIDLSRTLDARSPPDVASREDAAARRR